MRNKYTMPLALSIVAVVFELVFLYSAIFSGKEIVIAIAAFSLIAVSIVHGYTLRCWECERIIIKNCLEFIAIIENARDLFGKDDKDE